MENAPGLWAMIERASRILGALSGILVFPYPMRFLYDVYSLGEWHWFVSALAVIVSTLSLYALVKKPSLWAFGVVLIFAPLTIYLQFAPFSTWSLASERFVFVPVAGLSLLLMELLGRMTKPAAIGVLLLALILPCALATWQRISEWDGIGNALFDSEYQRQPGFHNAIRDRIIQTLIPEKRYDEARELAKRLGRAYAVEVMTRMIEADMAYDPFRKRSALSSLPDSREDAALRAEFCGASEQLRDAIRKGREQVKTEPDLSYNSILNALKNVQKYRFGHEKLLCATGKSATKSLTPPNSKKLAASRKLLPV